MTEPVNPGPWTTILPPGLVPLSYPGQVPPGNVPPGKVLPGQVPLDKVPPGNPGKRQSYPPNYSNIKPISPFRANKNVQLILTEQDQEDQEEKEDGDEEEEDEGSDGDSPISARSEPQSRMSRWSSLRSVRSFSSARTSSSSRRARENYHLRLRIYFLEERLNQGQADNCTEEVIVIREKLEASRSEHRLKDSLLQEAVEALAVLERERDEASLQLLQCQGQGGKGQAGQGQDGRGQGQEASHQLLQRQGQDSPARDDSNFILEETFEDFPLENYQLGDLHCPPGQGNSSGLHEECLGPAYRSLILELEQHREHFQDLLTNIRITNRNPSMWLQNEDSVVRKPEDCQPFFWEEHEDIQEKEQLVQEWSRRPDHLDERTSEDEHFSDCYRPAEEGNSFVNFDTEGAKTTLENLQSRFRLKVSGILRRIGDPDWPVVRRTGFSFLGFLLLLSISSFSSSSLSSSPFCLPYVPMAFVYTDSV